MAKPKRHQSPKREDQGAGRSNSFRVPGPRDEIKMAKAQIAATFRNPKTRDRAIEAMRRAVENGTPEQFWQQYRELEGLVPQLPDVETTRRYQKF